MKPTLVVGDLIIDAYHYGRLGGTAPDFPTILAHQHSTKLSYGGAGLVVSNILAQEHPVIFISLIGSGAYADYAHAYTHEKLTKLFLDDSTRPTTVKERFWVDGHKLLEWHHFESTPLGAGKERELLAHIKKQLPNAGKVVVADYRHGLLSERTAGTIVKLCKGARVPLYIDSQVVHAQANQRWYKGATLFLLNTKEAAAVDSLFDQKKIRQSLARLQKMLGTRNVIVKLAADGSASLFGDTFIKTKAPPVPAVDPVGAGDAFAAALVLGDAPPTRKDLERANIWAALSTTKIGTETPSLAEFEKHIATRRSIDE